MTNVYLNDEVIRRIDDSMLLDCFCLRIVENGCAYLDCRDSQLRYCGSCAACLAFDDSISREHHHYSEIEAKFDAVIREVEKLEAVTQDLSASLEAHRRRDQLTADLVHSLTQRITLLESTNTQLETQVNSLTQRLSQLESLSLSPRLVSSDLQVLILFHSAPRRD